MDVSWTSIHAVWGWHLALSSDTSVCTYWESREWHGLIQENSSSEQDSHEHWATGCVYMMSCDTCLTDLSALSVCGCSLSLLGVCLRAGGEHIPLSGRRSSCGQQQQQMVCHVTQLTSGRAAFLRNAQVSLGGACLAIQSQVMIPGWCLFGLIGLPWKQVASAWQCSYIAPRCQTESDYVSLKAQRSLSRAVLGVCPAVHSRHLLLRMEAGLNRLIFAWWREGNHPNQLYSVWLDLCKAVTARMSNLASVWKLSNGEVHMCMVARFIEANIWKIPSPFLLFSPQFTGRTVQVQRDFKWLNPLQTHIQLPFPPQEPAPCSAFSCSKMQGCPAPQLLHSGACKLGRGGTVPSKWGDVLSSSCWTSLSGADTCRHKTLNPGSPEVLKIFYKGICILLKQIAPGHPLQLYIKGMYTQRRERERELGRDSSRDCYLGDDAWLSKPVASEVIVESLFFCCHCKWLLAPESNLSDLLPRIRYGVCHALVSSLARSGFQGCTFYPN